MDHILPQAIDGPTVEENLALSCITCSLRKSDKTVAVDPVTEAEVQLFNPRNADWNTHFRWDGLRIAGLTATGRATVEAMDLNEATRLKVRRFQKRLGLHPSRT